MEQRVVLALLLLAAGVRCRSGGQPNVLLIIVDDLRPALGCYGDALAFTPHVDALASHGTVFTRAYAQQALCGPSRTSFLTSRRPDTTRLYDVHSYWRRHAGNFTTLPQYFKEHGFHTAAAGKVFHPGIVSNHSDDQPYSWSEAPYHPPTQAHKQDPVCLGPDGSLHTNIYCPVKVADQPGGSLPDIETTRHSTAWLEEWAERAGRGDGSSPSQPFLLAVGYHKPHIPLKFPREFLELFPIDTVPLAPNRWLPKGLPPVAWNPWNDMRSREDIAALNVSFPYGPMPDHYARYVRQGYYAAMSYTDSLIGDLLATVDRLFPDTIVAFIGDHGWSLGEHQEWSKFSNFEVATRVPFIIRGWRKRSNTHITPHSPPRRRAEGGVVGPGKEYSGLVELVDLFPTLVDLAGLPALEECPSDSHKVKVCTEGVSLSRIVSGNQRQIERREERDEEGFEVRRVDSNGIFSHRTNLEDAKNGFVQSEVHKQADDDRNDDDNEGFDAARVERNGIFSHRTNLGGAKSAFMQAEETRQTDNGRTDENNESFGGLNVGSNTILNRNANTDSTQNRFLPYEETDQTEYMKSDKNNEDFDGTNIGSNAISKRNVIDSTRNRFWPSENTDRDPTARIAAFSQYPRPGPVPSKNPDSDQPHTRDTTIMGYSVRTDRFRLTAWLRFDNATYRPDWDHIVALELYDHKIDPAEDRNIAGKRSYTRKRKALLGVLRGGWKSAVRWK